ILAPTVIGLDAAGRQQGRWPDMALATPPQPLQPERPARGATVALALVGLDAAAADSDRQDNRASGQPALAGVARAAADAERGERAGDHSGRQRNRDSNLNASFDLPFSIRDG